MLRSRLNALVIQQAFADEASGEVFLDSVPSCGRRGMMPDYVS